MMLASFPRITTTPGICDCRPTISGTRMRVSDVLEMLAGGATEAEIVGDFPYVTVDDVRACLSFAAHAAEHPVVGAG